MADKIPDQDLADLNLDLEQGGGDEQAFPWHETLWQRLWQDPERLPHALLLSGIPGLGKQAFARRLAHSLLCETPDSKGPCGTCKSCSLLAAGTHPDLLTVMPLEPGKPIVVDQSRELAEFIQLRPHQSKRKLVLIFPAERMNTNAANSLLKLLEEPPAGNIMILVSHAPSRLPVTILSRCVSFPFAPPALAQGMAWLEQASQGSVEAPWELMLRQAGRAPLMAQALASLQFPQKRTQWLQALTQLETSKIDPVQAATVWKSLGADLGLLWLQGWVADLIKIRSVPRNHELVNIDQAARLQESGKRLHLKALFDIFDLISRCRYALTGPLDEQLLLEDVFIRWYRLGERLATTAPSGI